MDELHRYRIKYKNPLGFVGTIDLAEIILTMDGGSETTLEYFINGLLINLNDLEKRVKQLEMTQR